MSRLIVAAKRKAILALLALLIATLVMPQTAFAATGDGTATEVTQGAAAGAATGIPEMKMGGVR
ncbi:MAG: hypothetical protein LBL63_04045 [Clostridiales Family XIII bacterium]|jgi:hypothetical protein|nr:hypothetical protein [Clostridiales Family XIII bacterium]